MRKYVWSRACSWLSFKVINGHICCGDKWHFSPLCHNGRSVSVSFRRRVCVAVWMRSVDCIDLCTCLSGRVTALNSSPRRCHSHFPGCHKATGRAQIRLTRLKRAVSRLSPCSIQLSVTTAPPKIIEVEWTGGIGFHVCVCVCAERRVWCEVFGKHWLIKFQCQALGSGTSSCGGGSKYVRRPLRAWGKGMMSASGSVRRWCVKAQELISQWFPISRSWGSFSVGVWKCVKDTL